MIAYEELERALARWKARHAGVAAPLDGSVGSNGSNGSGRTDAAVLAEAAADVTGRTPERTSEIDIGDADTFDSQDDSKDGFGGGDR